MTTRSNKAPAGHIMTAEQLSARYDGKVSVKTLANWRSVGKGPPYTKVGKRVFYILDCVQAWEKDNQRTQVSN